MKKIRMTKCVMVDENPFMASISDGSTHYRFTLRKGDRSFSAYFSMGPAHCREPEAAEIVSCLLSDAAIHENDEYDEPGIGHKVARKMEEQAERFKHFMGDDYEESIWGNPDENAKRITV